MSLSVESSASLVPPKKSLSYWKRVSSATRDSSITSGSPPEPT